MEGAALGIRLHTGRAAAVVLAGPVLNPRVVDRRRFRLVESDEHDSVFVYHAAAELSPAAGARHLSKARTVAERCAHREVGQLLSDLGTAGHALRVVGLPGPSRRPLPPPAEILRSHLHIHSAELELYRGAFAKACAELGVPAILVPRTELLEAAARATRVAPLRLTQCLGALGRALGPPWARDEKDAALAALIAASNAHETRG